MELLRMLRSAISTLPLGKQLLPAWLDEARLIVQLPEFERITALYPFRGRCLNAGSGEGLFSGFLEAFPEITEIVNIDLTRPLIAARRTDPRHRDQQGSLTALPFADESFDSCLCSEVLEHIPDDAVAVAELARVLKPGAMLLVSVPTPPAPADPAHAREGYQLDELTRLLEGAGFEVVMHVYCFHTLMRGLHWLWSWQYALRGRNFFPRAAVRAAAHADRWSQVGRPWDLIVLSRRRA